MAKHVVKCPICGESFDTNAIDKDCWVKNGRRYYHKECYNSDDTSLESKIISYCMEVLGPSCNINYINRRLKQYKKEGRTYLDIYNTLVYWYDIKQSDPSKANGGIGIVGYIYDESKEYWERVKRLEQKAKEPKVEIIEKEADKVTYYTTPVKKPKRVHLFDIS